MYGELLKAQRENAYLRTSLYSEQLKTLHTMAASRRDRAVQKRNRELELNETKRAPKERKQKGDVLNIVPYTPLSTEQAEGDVLNIVPYTPLSTEQAEGDVLNSIHAGMNMHSSTSHPSSMSFSFAAHVGYYYPSVPGLFGGIYTNKSLFLSPGKMIQILEKGCVETTSSLVTQEDHEYSRCPIVPSKKQRGSFFI